jgi:alkaline phosphatase
MTNVDLGDIRIWNLMNISNVILAVTCFSLMSCQTHVIDKNAEDKQPKNIILLIGDGMGLAHLEAAMTASNKTLNIERCSETGFAKTSSSDEYITDSAAAATAIACGKKTYNGAIGVDSLGNNVKSILEYAEEAGLATGLVATSTITHATPASFIAHDDSRQHYEAIARDFLETDTDVFIGGGLSHFDNRKDSINLVEILEINGYQIALNTQELEHINSGKLVGLLNDKSMPRMTEGRQEMLLKSGEKAIEILSQNKKGFFLMIEGSQIDWGGHDNDIEYVVTELLDFDQVVGAALDFAQQDGNTLVIVTADHETGGLAILGKDIMKDPLATKFSTTHHTAVMVPVYAYGPQADKFAGIYENNTLFHKMMNALNLRWD